MQKRSSPNRKKVPSDPHVPPKDVISWGSQRHRHGRYISPNVHRNNVANIFIGGRDTKGSATTADMDTLRMLSESPPKYTGSAATTELRDEIPDILGGLPPIEQDDIPYDNANAADEELLMELPTYGDVRIGGDDQYYDASDPLFSELGPATGGGGLDGDDSDDDQSDDADDAEDADNESYVADDESDGDESDTLSDTDLVDGVTDESGLVGDEDDVHSESDVDELRDYAGGGMFLMEDIMQTSLYGLTAMSDYTSIAGGAPRDAMHDVPIHDASHDASHNASHDTVNSTAVRGPIGGYAEVSDTPRGSSYSTSTITDAFDDIGEIDLFGGYDVAQFDEPSEPKYHRATIADEYKTAAIIAQM